MRHNSYASLLSRLTLTMEILLAVVIIANGNPAQCTISPAVSKLLENKNVKEACVDKHGRLYPCPSFRSNP